MKKLFAMLLSFAMLFTLAMPAMAAEVSGNTQNPTEQDVSGSYTPTIEITEFYIEAAESTYDNVVVYDETTDTYTFIIVDEESACFNMVVGIRNRDYTDLTNAVFRQHNTESYSNKSFLEYFEYNSTDGKYHSDGWSYTMYAVGETMVRGVSLNGTDWTEVTCTIVQAYSITNETASDANGTVTVPEWAKPGDTVTVNVSPKDSNYGLNTLTVTDASGNPVTVTNNQFTMPEGKVTVSATFKYTGTYDITVNDSENGSVTADVNKAAENTTVTLTVAPDADYELDTITVNDGAVELTKVNDTTYTFAMPAGNATVSATFKQIKRAVNIGTIENGTVTANPTTAATGETVTLTVDPAAEYMLDDLKVVNDTTGEEVTIAADNTFVMPNSSVTVTATFVEMPITSVEITWGSMSFTYDDTIPEGETEETGWTCDTGANRVTVKNSGEEGDNTFTAQAAYTPNENYEAITGKFDVESAELAVGESQTFTLTLTGKPATALTEGTKIGKVTITINEAAEG